MSTVDSQLILASAGIVKDLYLNYINPGAAGKPEENVRLHRMSFYVTGILGVIVFLAAFRPPSLIVWMNLFAFGGLQAAFLWPLLLGLYWKRANAAGALASMVAGVGSYFYMVIFVKRFMGMHVIVPTLAIALAVFIVGSLVTPPLPESRLKKFWD
jgi:sodium/pantothenate symporter